MLQSDSEKGLPSEYALNIAPCQSLCPEDEAF
jgi:hypothetical protein